MYQFLDAPKADEKAKWALARSRKPSPGVPGRYSSEEGDPVHEKNEKMVVAAAGLGHPLPHVPRTQYGLRRPGLLLVGDPGGVFPSGGPVRRALVERPGFLLGL